MLAIEKQVCNVEQARFLKQIGVPQEGSLSWVYDSLNERLVLSFHSVEALQFIGREGWSAFTVAELGELLSQLDHEKLKRDGADFEASYDWYHKKYGFRFRYLNDLYETEAESRAELLRALHMAGYFYPKAELKKKSTFSDKS
jgi:hypothetical protein